MKENITEVEGCWSSPEHKTKCRACGSILKPTPKQNHPNSKYWELQRDDGCQLYCCPKGCTEETASNTQHAWMKISRYCTKQSHSWKWKLDYTKINDGWLSPDGQLHPVDVRHHIEFADKLDMSERELENIGYIKLANNDFIICHKPNQLQLDVIFDYLKDNKKTDSIKRFSIYLNEDTN